MFNIIKEEIKWEKTPFIIETGKIARQADGSVIVTYGETTILCTVVFAKDKNTGTDISPLNVNYQEKFYSTGKIPGGFFKRESRFTEKEIITSRLIDRPLRPLIHEDFKQEIQILVTVISNDKINSPDIPSIIGASTALSISGVPIVDIIGAARIGYAKDKYILNPSREEINNCDLNMIIAGTQKSILMVESESSELPENIILDAIKFGHEKIQVIIETIKKIRDQVNKIEFKLEKRKIDYNIQKILIEYHKNQYIINNHILKDKDYLLKIKKHVETLLNNIDSNLDEDKLFNLLKKIEKKIIRNKIITTLTRLDGRKINQIREINCEIGLLARTHGSALFTRGSTQSLGITTLGTSQDEQIVDAIEGEYKERFILNYNFPPYAVGETGRIGSPKRREIGHGKLAYKALNCVLPDLKNFPYTIRLVSEITESNGSSSMATVCSGTLSMMDAGVPLKNIVAGIAMGLITDNDTTLVLSDISGEEDHIGDMDFKVAGSKNGITSLQMDIKLQGIKIEIIEESLLKAKTGRLYIIDKMEKVIDKPKKLGRYAPKMTSINIPQEKIKELIGSGGKTIKEICETTNSKIDISNEGVVKISSEDQSNIDNALKRIEEIVMEPEVGQIYKGKVVKIMDFGAFINFLGPRDGLVHISELTQERIKKVSDIINEGDTVYVQLVGFDRGKARLSMKVVDQKTGKSISRMSIQIEE